MNKKKTRAFAWATAAVLAFTPFLGGCAADDGADNADNPGAQQELTYDEQQRNETEGSIGQNAEGVQYGQVMAVNGNQATVVVGELENAADGSGQTFTSGQDEITFDMTEVEIVDESGAQSDDQALSVDDVIIMSGTGEGSNFKPEKVEIVEVATVGMDAGGATAAQNTNTK